MTLEQFAAVFRRHVDRFDQILDPDWHAVDRRQWGAGSIPFAGFVSGGAGRFRVDDFPRFHVVFDGIDLFETTFQIGAWRIRPVTEPRNGIVKRH